MMTASCPRKRRNRREWERDWNGIHDECGRHTADMSAPEVAAILVIAFVLFCLMFCGICVLVLILKRITGDQTNSSGNDRAGHQEAVGIRFRYEPSGMRYACSYPLAHLSLTPDGMVLKFLGTYLCRERFNIPYRCLQAVELKGLPFFPTIHLTHSAMLTPSPISVGSMRPRKLEALLLERMTKHGKRNSRMTARSTAVEPIPETESRSTENHQNQE